MNLEFAKTKTTYTDLSQIDSSGRLMIEFNQLQQEDSKDKFQFTSNPSLLSKEERSSVLQDGLLFTAGLGMLLTAQAALPRAAVFISKTERFAGQFVNHLKSFQFIEKHSPVLSPAVREAAVATPEGKQISQLVESEAGASLLGKLELGVRGAWLVESNKAQHVFKIASKNDITDQLKLTASAVSAVDSLFVRTPTIEKFGFNKPHGTWYLQEFLQGFPAKAPTDKLIAGMIDFNHRQAGAALQGSKNWSEQVMSALYKDSHGWKDRIAASGQEGRALVNEVNSLVERNRMLELRSGDIVHADFQHFNALESSTGRLKAIVDWEGSGRGDRGFDLSRLLYDSYVSEREIGFRVKAETIAMLSNKIKDLSGAAARDNYLGYWVLQVADYGIRMRNDKSKMFIDVGHRILDDLKNTGRYRLSNVELSRIPGYLYR